ncbi:MAG: DMT family transporter [Hyphomicrobiales bacterium]|nr:DMT family transporter [Hyphomicrobiales bacterium]
MPFQLTAIAHANNDKAISDGSEILGYATGLLTWLLAGGVFVAVKLGGSEMPPFMFVCVRVLLASALLLPLVHRHYGEMRAFLSKHGIHVLIVGGIGLGLTQGLLFLALGHTTAVNAGIVFAIAPILTLVLAHFVLREEMGVWQVLGSLIAFGGIVFVAVKGSLDALIGLDVEAGDLIVLLGAILFAGYSVLIKRAKFSLGRLPLLTILLAGGFLATLPFALWEIWNGEHENLNRAGYLALAYIVIPGGALMYLMLNWSIDVLGASRAGVLLYTQMIFTAILAWLILGEAIEWYHFVGAGLVILGVVVVSARKPGHVDTPAH